MEVVVGKYKKGISKGRRQGKIGSCMGSLWPIEERAGLLKASRGVGSLASQMLAN